MYGDGTKSITVGELIDILVGCPREMRVLVSCDRFVRKILKVKSIVDMDTNEVSVDVIAEDRL